MCYLCEEYGEGGIWYLNPMNYARNMYKLREPGKKAEGPGVYLEGGAEGGPGLPELMKAIEKGDQQAYDKIRLGDLPPIVVPLLMLVQRTF